MKENMGSPPRKQQLPSDKSTTDNSTNNNGENNNNGTSLFRFTKCTNKSSFRGSGLSLRGENKKSNKNIITMDKTVLNEVMMTKHKRQKHYSVHRHVTHRPHRNYFRDLEDRRNIPIPKFSSLLSPDRDGGVSKSTSLSSSKPVLQKELQDNDDNNDDSSFKFQASKYDTKISHPKIRNHDTTKKNKPRKQKQPAKKNVQTTKSRLLPYIDIDSSDDDDMLSLPPSVFTKSQQQPKPNSKQQSSVDKSNATMHQQQKQNTSITTTKDSRRRDGDIKSDVSSSPFSSSSQHLHSSNSRTSPLQREPQLKIAQLTQSVIQVESECTTSIEAIPSSSSSSPSPKVTAEWTQSAIEEVSDWTSASTQQLPQEQNCSNGDQIRESSGCAIASTGIIQKQSQQQSQQQQQRRRQPQYSRSIIESRKKSKKRTASPLIRIAELTQSAIEKVSEWSTEQTRIEMDDSKIITTHGIAGTATNVTRIMVTAKNRNSINIKDIRQRNKPNSFDDNMKVSELTQSAVEEISEWTTGKEKDNASDDESDCSSCDEHNFEDNHKSATMLTARTAVLKSSPLSPSSDKPSSLATNSCTISTPKPPNTKSSSNLQQPTPQLLVASVDHLYSHVDNLENVTIKEIMATETEYNVKLQMSNKVLVRHRLKDLLVSLSQQSQQQQTHHYRNGGSIATILKTVYTLFENISNNITTITVRDILQAVHDKHNIKCFNKNDEKLICEYLKDLVTTTTTTAATQPSLLVVPESSSAPSSSCSTTTSIFSVPPLYTSSFGNAGHDSISTHSSHKKVDTDVGSLSGVERSSHAAANSKDNVSSRNTRHMEHESKLPKLLYSAAASCGSKQTSLKDIVELVPQTANNHEEKTKHLDLGKIVGVGENVECDVKIMEVGAIMLPSTSCCPKQDPATDDLNKTPPSKAAPPRQQNLSKNVQPAPHSKTQQYMGGAVVKQKKQTTIKRKRQMKDTAETASCVNLTVDAEAIAKQTQTNPTVTPNRTKRARTKKGSCAMCNTCSCQTGNTLDTAQTLGLGNVSKSVRDVENALIRRVKKLEKSKDWYADLADQVRRDLKKHRRTINRDRESKLIARNGGNDKAASGGGSSVDLRFLPDADEWDVQLEEAHASPLETSRISEAQQVLFACNANKQPTLTQMFGNPSESKKVGDSEETDNDAVMVEAFGASSHTRIENQLREMLPSEGNGEDAEVVPAAAETEEEVIKGCIHRMSWRGGAPKHNDDVSGSPVRGGGVWAALLEKNNQHMTGRIDVGALLSSVVGVSQYTSSFDQLFNMNEKAANQGDELEDLLNMFDNPSLVASQSHTMDCQKSDNLVEVSLLTQRRQSTAKNIEDKFTCDPTKHDVIEQGCPNWSENVRYALAQTEEIDVQEALDQVTSTKERLAAAKKKMLDLFCRREVALQLHETSLKKSLRHLKPGCANNKTDYFSVIHSDDEQE